MPADVQEFMISIVKKQIDHRETNNITKKDFIQILIQLRNTGEINVDDSEWDVKMLEDSLKTMSIEQCAAQVFLFYVAGYETSSSTMSYCLFEFAKNQEILKKIQEEIDTVLARYNGVLTYECINNMEYMDLCIMGEFFFNY